MHRVFLAAVLLICLPLTAHAGDSVIQLKVRPTPAPKPALKYYLLPEVRELTPGNPAQWYFRCFAEQRNFFFNKEVVAQRGRYLKIPLAELAKEAQRGYGGFALKQADWAARLNAVDWQVLEHVQTDGLDMRQPELGPLRVLATALKVRFRMEVAGQYFDDAIVTAKTMFALARHLGEHPTRAANQLGLYVANLALDVLEEMVQQPNSPNLYWAWTELPTPLVDLRKGFQGESILIATELQSLREDAVMTADELEKVVSRFSGLMGRSRMQAGQPPRSLRSDLMARAKDADKVRALRDRMLKEQETAVYNRIRAQSTARAFFGNLLEMGQAKDVIQKMPPLQVILLNEKREFEIQSGERMKLLALSPSQIDMLGGEELERGASCFLADFLPQVIQARREQGVLERRIALLRHVEALRLYSASHDGKLPSKLSDIALPLPNDPFTDKPIAYRVEGATARLRGGAPRGEEKNAAYNVLYEVTLQK
ncbi:MAG TPA: hypothetical protein VH592_24415 [Gemmataceae bacterium]